GRRDRRRAARVTSQRPPRPAALTSGAVLLTRKPAIPAPAYAASERHDQNRSTRARSRARATATNASAVYCFSQVWSSTAAEAAPATPQHSPYSHDHRSRFSGGLGLSPPDPLPNKLPSRQAARAVRAAKARGRSGE